MDIYVIVGIICLFVAITTGTILAIMDDRKTVNTKLVTKGLDNNNEEISKALEHLRVCNSVNDED